MTYVSLHDVIRDQLAGIDTYLVNDVTPLHADPTLAEITAVIAIVEHSTNEAAAAALGVSPMTIKNHLSRLSARLGAHNRTHLVWMLWPVLRDAYPDFIRRQGDRRRTA